MKNVPILKFGNLVICIYKTKVKWWCSKGLVRKPME